MVFNEKFYTLMSTLLISGIASAQLVSPFNSSDTSADAVKTVLLANIASKNHIEWHSSGKTPEDLMKFIRSGSRDSMKLTVCDSLQNLSATDLSLFENEIENTENKEIFAACSANLKEKIADYYSSERAKLTGFNRFSATRGGPVQFQTQIQKREVRDGYFAVRGDVAPKEIILTFDDGPHGVNTPRILDALKEVNAQVIFFHMGENVYKHPEILQREASEGHMIGSHTWSHLCLPSSSTCKRSNGYRLSFEQAIEEIKKAHKAIYDVLGWVAPFFRFPYGEASPELKQYLKQNQTAEFFWNIDSNDWRTQSPSDLLTKTLAEVERNGRGIVLFHDIQTRTAEMLPEFLKELYYRNYNLVLLKPVDETQLTRPTILQN